MTSLYTSDAGAGEKFTHRAQEEAPAGRGPRLVGLALAVFPQGDDQGYDRAERGHHRGHLSDLPHVRNLAVESEARVSNEGRGGAWATFAARRPVFKPSRRAAPRRVNSWKSLAPIHFRELTSAVRARGRRRGSGGG